MDSFPCIPSYPQFEVIHVPNIYSHGLLLGTAAAGLPGGLACPFSLQICCGICLEAKLKITIVCRPLEAHRIQVLSLLPVCVCAKLAWCPPRVGPDMGFPGDIIHTFGIDNFA